jgi:hypothetical protein
MDKEERPKNNFVHCVCGITYISGYTHCPKCGVPNPNDNNPIHEKPTPEVSGLE